MSSLTEVAYASRKIIKFGGLGMGVFLLLWVGVGAAIKAYQRAHPPYVAPTVRFGVLDKIVFPQKEFQKRNFVAELPNDEFPKFKDQANVYVIYRPKSMVMALEFGKKTAALMDFTGEPQQISTGVYRFSDSARSSNLEMNVLESSFKMSYPYLTDQLLQNPEKMPSREEAISQAKAYLQRAEKLTPDLENGTQEVSFWKISYSGLQKVEGLSEANIVRVDFFRQNLADGITIVSTQPGESPVSVLVSGSTVNNKKIVEVNYKHVEVDTTDNSASTYPIKSVQTAFEELKAGNYWPASDSNSQDVVIRKVYLAYFEPVTLTQFLQPVYVFEGDNKNNFVGYVPAVSDNYAK